MNVQPKPSRQTSQMPGQSIKTDPYAPMRAHGDERRPRHVPVGPRLFVTWPVEFEVDPWRP